MLKNIVRGAAVGLLTFSLGMYADAKPKGGGNQPQFQPQGAGGNVQKKPGFQFQGKGNAKSPMGGNGKNFSPKNFGKPFSPSFFYSGKDCCFWNHCCWYDYLGCEIYWCPKTCHWFYYCEPACCYYIVEECPGY